VGVGLGVEISVLKILDAAIQNVGVRYFCSPGLRYSTLVMNDEIVSS
jgi:hypothetical protein